jgi:hypothetical protein
VLAGPQRLLRLLGVQVGRPLCRKSFLLKSTISKDSSQLFKRRSLCHFFNEITPCVVRTRTHRVSIEGKFENRRFSF